MPTADDDRNASEIVLLVEDDLEIRAAVEETLRGAGYEVAAVRDGHEAMRYIDTHPVPDVIITDLFMPVINGWDLAAKLRQNPKASSIPVVVTTASGPHWGYPVPQNRVLQKPFNEDQLLKVVAGALMDASAAARDNR
jgi:two-component system, chemotaxis family, chemotaxis protein CheY